ncbi:tetratricopeptide repeat protein [Olavius algarvensis spirochete endosymbiont]|uniref:tetratricopeptide repeat protein n=1 Tax=Olavius algarvensis spirochete endosymbiont TaxID=260710 RepID=UPI0018A8602B|nr:tetratricopeptide repeat protein [Olavius algarvensis spirochete endosymbiont]
MPASLSRNDVFTELFTIAQNSTENPAMRFVALEPIIARARTAGEIAWLNRYLGNILSSYPEDPYGAYYLAVMAENVGESKELALDYLRRLLKNYPDLKIDDESIHFLAMNEIAKQTNNPREAILMRMRMQQHYSDRIDLGRNYFAIAGLYRKLGDWEAMYQAYENFLKHPNTIIPGNSNAANQIEARLTFHRSDKSWTVDKLDDLVAIIKRALRTQNGSLLKKHQSVDFFLMSWSQETSDPFTHIPMPLESFLTSTISYRSELEKFSNNSEAYLWTTGWTWMIPTWYLYFRRIDYPADPEINGNWEWAGIYFGERL